MPRFSHRDLSYAKEPFFHFVYNDGDLERLQNKLKLGPQIRSISGFKQLTEAMIHGPVFADAPASSTGLLEWSV